MSGQLRVYVAGPYTAPDPAVNVRVAMEAAHRLMDMGHAPYCPHLSHYLHIHRPRPYEEWMELDLAWVERCDCLLRLPGYSPGADREVENAEKIGIPVFESVEQIEEWLR